MITTVTKSYRDLPAAHRQPGHDGHCRLIHGHNWGFDITFACDTLDSNGFVVDVGKLSDVKAFLNSHFDHTLLLNLEDPLVKGHGEFYRELVVFASIVLVPNCGMEGLAKFVFDRMNKLLADRGRGLRIVRVVCFEDEKNSATYSE